MSEPLRWTDNHCHLNFREADTASVNRAVATARDVGESGPDTLYGFGLVDAAAAVSADVPLVDANLMGDLAEWIRTVVTEH